MFFYSDFVDVDECSNNNGGCNADATCQNTEGSFTCTCKPGYSGDGFNCVGRLIRQTMTKMKFQDSCWQSIINSRYLRIILCLACVYRILDVSARSLESTGDADSTRNVSLV